MMKTNHLTIKKKARNLVCLDINMFFFMNEIAFNMVVYLSFVNICKSIGLYS